MKPTAVTLAAKSLCLALAIALAQSAFAASPTAENAVLIKKLERQNELLEKQIDEMKQQMSEIKQQLAEMKQQTGGLLADQAQSAKAQQQLKTEVAQASEAATQAAHQVAQQTAQATAQAEARDKLSIWGYGELYYTQPKDKDKTQADLARAVFGIGYQFDDKTRFNSEFEVEHGVASASDPGEFEVEQFYVDHKFNDNVGLKAGLFLIPAGFLNENHEPTNYYGVQRNFVETLIIPSTWREGGLSLHGTTDNGFEWHAGITTGLNLSKWNFTPESAPYTTALELEDNDIAPMQATHQEMALANAKHLSEFVALNYRGVPGLTLGGTYFTGAVVPAQATLPDNERVTLWETHARYQPGKLDLQALYARGTISNTGEANALYPGTANPIPASFDGWFVQGAYNVWQSGGYRLAPFLRYEKYDMGASYEGIAPGFSATPTGSVPSSTVPTTFSTFAIPHDTVDTIGANFYLNPNVVFKIDYQKFRVNTDFSRLDLGMGLQF
jgi:hypothetical protein